MNPLVIKTEDNMDLELSMPELIPSSPDLKVIPLGNSKKDKNKRKKDSKQTKPKIPPIHRNRRIFKSRKQKANVINSSIGDVMHSKKERSTFLEELKKFASEKNKKITSWNTQLKDCKNKLIESKNTKQEAKSIGNALALIKKADDKLDTLAKVFNYILQYINKEIKICEKQTDDISKLKDSFNNYVNESLEEMNKLIVMTRSEMVNNNTNKEEDNEFSKGIKTSYSNGGIHTTGGPTFYREPKVLITALFRLYDYDHNTKINKLFLNGKNKKEKTKY